MDNSSVGSDLIETLDYLRPPVKRLNRENQDYCYLKNCLESVRALKHIRSKYTKKIQHPPTKIRGVETTSSLILKKTRETEVSEKYTVYSHTNLHRKEENQRSLWTKEILSAGAVKPIIEVTVTPKTVQTQTSALIKKRKRITKKVQATVSNHEINSIHAKNLILVVGGQKKEGVYDFKRTGSAKFISSDIERLTKEDDITYDQLSSVKLVLDSLNMDKRKDIKKKKKSKRSNSNSPDALVDSRYLQGNEMIRGCSCSKAVKDDNVMDTNPRKSRVRITGRLGLTDEDRYVLKCDASVDDKPVYTDVSAVQYYTTQQDDLRVSNICDADVRPPLKGFARNFRISTNSDSEICSPLETFPKICRCQRESKDQASMAMELPRNTERKSTNLRYQICSCCDPHCSFTPQNNRTYCNKKDSNIQVDSQEITAATCCFTSRPQICQASHGTQVNFNMTFTNPECYNFNSPVKDEIVQCCCTLSNSDEECSGESTSESEGDYDNDIKGLKRCQSPMVVISVYPMQNDLENVEVVTDPPIDSRHFSTKAKTHVNKDVAREGTSKKPVRESRPISTSPRRPRSRSPTPQTKIPYRPRSRSPIPQTKIPYRSRSGSPSPPTKITKNRSQSPPTKIQSKTHVTQTKPLRTSISRRTSPTKDRYVGEQTKTNRQVTPNKEKLTRERNKTVIRPDVRSKKENKTTITDHNVTKKLLVDNYTKHLTAFMQHKELENDCDCLLERHSKQNIDAGAGSELCDLMLCPGRNSEDFKTRNCKEPAKKTFYKESLNTSPQHSLLEHDQTMQNRCVPQDVSKNERQNEDTFTRLRVKDSLEISHRPTNNGKNTKNHTANKGNTPIKHFRGDNCLILDPLKRDQEIRALLGIGKNRDAGTTKAFCSVYSVIPRCIYDKICDDYSLDDDECVCTDIINQKRVRKMAPRGTAPSSYKLRCECCPSYPSEVCKCYMNKSRGHGQNHTKFIQKNTKNKAVQCECPVSSSDTSDDKQEEENKDSTESSSNDSVSQKTASNKFASIENDEQATKNNSVPCKCPETCISSSDDKQEEENKDSTESSSNDSVLQKTAPASKKPASRKTASKKFASVENDKQATKNNFVQCECPVSSSDTSDDKQEEENKDSTESSNDSVVQKTASKKSASRKTASKKNASVENKDSKKSSSNVFTKKTASKKSASKKFGSKKADLSDTKAVVENKDPNESSTNDFTQQKSDLNDPVIKKTASKKSQYEEAPVQRSALYQQLILNRNIQVFLQVEQFSKQKPIVLSRKQYDKVKRIIDNTITNNKSKHKKCVCKCSSVSVGEVRRKTKQKQNKIETQQQTGSDKSKSSKGEQNRQAYFVFTGKQNANDKDQQTPRQVASTLEFQYASLSYTKYVTFSSTNVEVGSMPSPLLDEKESLSLHTIFKGRRRCASPNLGNSVYSLDSEDAYPQPQLICEPKQKKPFLRRLISCLAMRSRVTAMLPGTNAALPPSNKSSVNSTFDPYYISSSFCGVEMSSSMYDTSVSFYSNHSVYPINSKIKRGFFNSVREFLSIRKSQSMKNP